MSAVGAFSAVVIGAIGIAMMLVGGASIRAGEMTIGDFVMYLTLTALVTVPIIQLASIGTQMTEAFAGLDRIREIRRMATEDDEDAARAPMPDIRGDVEFDDVSFEYTAGAGAEARVVSRAGRFDDGARRIERLGQEHPDQPGHDVQSAAVGSRPG